MRWSEVCPKLRPYRNVGQERECAEHQEASQKKRVQIGRVDPEANQAEKIPRNGGSGRYLGPGGQHDPVQVENGKGHEGASRSRKEEMQEWWEAARVA